MFTETLEWLIGIGSLVVIVLLARRLWCSMALSTIWASWAFAAIGVWVTYVAKATEIALSDEGFHTAWGVGRRWGDVSHWFTWLLVAVSLGVAAACSVLCVRDKQWLAVAQSSYVRKGHVAGTIIVSGVYLVLVRVADDGQTFFFPAGWLTARKWIQVLEGVWSIALIAIGQMFWLLMLLSFVQIFKDMAKKLGELIPTIGLYVGFLITSSVFVIWHAKDLIQPAIQAWATPRMPNYEAEFGIDATGAPLDSFHAELVFYQFVGLIVVPASIAFIVAWLWARSQDREAKQSDVQQQPVKTSRKTSSKGRRTRSRKKS